MRALLPLKPARSDKGLPSAADPGHPGNTSLRGLRPGERLRLEELLYGLLLPSGNDAAMAIARYLAGSEPAFVARMNARAVELGLASTHFANSHGLDEAGHYSTPADLLKLTRVAMRNPTF